MAVTPAELKQIATEFSAVDDARVQLFIDQAERRTNREAWGAKADDGVIYLAAHLLTLDKGQGAAAAGLLQSVSVDGVSKSYAVAAPTGNALETNAWGRAYLDLRSTIFASRVF